jgi:Domain of unknown function (DUF4276)
LIKIGIFVEGQTERIFVVKFLSEYLGGEHNFSRIELENLGSKGTRVITTRDYPKAQYYILIFDSTGDGNVVPSLLDRAQNMIENENYSFLIALQDLYDRPREAKKMVIGSVRQLYNKTPFAEKLRFTLSIMEIESWLLIDYNLFRRLNDIATPEYIRENLNLDIVNTNPEEYDHPTTILNKLYNLFGQKYKKSEDQIYTIVNKIDFDYLYSDEILDKVKSWGYFVNVINNCL